MQFLPAAPELLAAIARLLDEQVLAVVPTAIQHQVRVAGHLAAMLQREAELGSETKRRETELIGTLLGIDADNPAATLDERLRTANDPAFEARAWHALVEIARADLAIAKPGHDAYEGT